MSLKPIHKVFLKIDKPFEDEIQMGELKLYVNPEYNPEWRSTTSAVVANTPIGYNGKVKKGDEVAVSFRVVATRSFVHDKRELFSPVEENPYQRKFLSNQGSWIQVIAFEGLIGLSWVGTCVDKFNNFVSGMQGNEHELERWLSQFSFSQEEKYNFDNLIEIGGDKFWKCNTDEIFAKKVNGKIVAVGDRIICQPIEADVKDRYEIMTGNALPYNTVRVRLQDRAYMVSGGEDMGFKEGDILAFRESYVERYNLWGKDYFLVKKKRIIGLWQGQ